MAPLDSLLSQLPSLPCMEYRASNNTNANDDPFSAFGGMVAFCVIMGDTIPSVIAALSPNFPRLPFLWLLTNRRAMIMACTLGLSYPLSLYRDIAKVRTMLPFIAEHSLTISVSESVYASTSEHDGNESDSRGLSSDY